MSESQTPRVDAAEFAYCDDLTDLVVESSLARQLESELTTTRARLSELEGIADRLYQTFQITTMQSAGAVKAYEAYKKGKK